MADEQLTIKLVADKVLQQATEGYQTVSKAGKVSKTDAAQFQALTKQIQDIGNTNNITTNTYRQLRTASNQLNELMKKLGNSMGEVSNATKEQLKAIADQRRKVAALQSEVDSKSKSLSRRKTNLSGNAVEGYGYSTAQLNELVKASGITWAKSGKPVQQYSTFAKHMMSGDSAAFSNPSLATEKFTQWPQEEKRAIAEYLNSKQQLTSAEDRLHALEADTITVNAGEEVIVNATKSQSEVESFVHTNLDQPTDETQVAPNGEGLEFQSSTASLGKAFKQLSLYRIAWAQVKKVYREVISTITELDKSLTEQAMVTGKTREQTYALLGTYQDMASELGTTTKEVASVATEYMRQGKTVSESLTLTTAAVSAAKVAGISASESINYLTTALNGFQLTADEALSVSDKFAAVAATSATDYEELAVALSKVASQANLAGMSIDYTTALLAKGIETTREAPETIGTALKTVIARMREISDYGETLDGSTDVNNVETQLAYVGIALKDTNGELRSTEDVLDELGKKWDTLNSNQQAAIAKALAGTRQQSRLIAMMSDYERVLELQQTSLRSSGATVAQLSTYLEGIEAATNRVSVAIEKVTTAFTSSDWVVGLVNSFATLIDFIGTALQQELVIKTTLVGMAVIMTSMAAIKAKQLIQRTKELKIQAQLNQLEKISTFEKQKQYILALKTAKTVAEQNNDQAKVAQLNAQLSIEESKLEIFKNQALETGAIVTNQEKLDDLTTWTLGSTSDWVATLSQGGVLLSGLVSIYKAFCMWKDARQSKELAQAAASTTANANVGASKIIGQLGVYGIAVAAAVLAAFGVSAAIIGGGLSGLASQQEQAAEKINTLSTDIYNLSTRATELQSLVDTYEELDRHIIQTTADQEEFNTTLDEAADKMTEEQKAVYESLSTNKLRLDYIKQIIAQSKAEAAAKRQEQLSLVASNPELLTDTSDSAQKVQSDVYATANQLLYDYDDIKGYDSDVETVVQAILEGLSATEAYQYAINPSKIYDIADALNSLGTASIFTSDSASLKEKIEAYNGLSSSLQGLIDNVYPYLSKLSQWGPDIVGWMDSMSITTSDVNDLNEALYSLGYTTEEAYNYIYTLFNYLTQNPGADLSTAIQAVFGDLSPEEYQNVLNAYSKAISSGILTIGQNVDKITNTISEFYDKAADWSTLSETEKSEFISSNSGLFQNNPELLTALESGDYNAIEAALRGNETLAKQIEQQISTIDRELAIEEARVGEQRDEAYIQYLKELKQQLEDTENIYKASLETRLEQEQKYIDEYKSYLEDQKTALVDSLNDRKDAYQDYFDAVNQQADDDDFEEQQSTLIANIAKLATSTSASAVNTRADLEQQLADLEEERLQTLRERSQDQVISNIENAVDEINDKFDDLLNSNSALLAAMTGELDDPVQFITNLLDNKVQTEGLTGLGMQDYIQDLTDIYGSIPGMYKLLSDIEVSENGDNFTINIGGEEIQISANDQQSIKDAIYKALTSIGKR